MGKMLNEKWHDSDGRKHKAYVVRSAGPSRGFEVLDTYRRIVVQTGTTRQECYDWLASTEETGGPRHVSAEMGKLEDKYRRVLRQYDALLDRSVRGENVALALHNAAKQRYECEKQVGIYAAARIGFEHHQAVKKLEREAEKKGE